MNFLNKEKKEARWLTIVLGIVLSITYMFANASEADMLARSMTLMGMPMNLGLYILTLIGTAGISYLFFILFISFAYSLAYRSLVKRTRDIKAMPICKESFVNHVQFVMIFANILIGIVSMLLRMNLIVAPVVDMLARMLIKAGTYVIVLFLLARVGIGDNVKEKLFGGFLVPLAVYTLLMV